MIHRGGVTCNSVTHVVTGPSLLAKNCIYILAKKKNIYIYIYTKLTCLDHPDKNIDYPNLKIIKILVQ